MRLIDLNTQKKTYEDAARYWRGLAQRTDTVRESERCFLFDCINTNLARIAELDILKALGAALLLALLLPFTAHAADRAPRHVTKPVSTITVKVVTAADFTRGKLTKDLKPWRITTSDADSCTAWVSSAAPNLPTAQLNAFVACQSAIFQAGKDGAR